MSTSSSPRSGRGTSRSGLHPGLHQCTRLLLRARRGGAAEAGLPGPADEGVLADMVDQVFHLAAAVARGIPDLLADLTDALAFPGHFARGEVPVGMAGHAAGLEIGALVAGVATHRFEPMAVGAARHRRLMKAGIVALVRSVAGGMAVGAARMRQHFSELGENRGRALFGVGNACEAFGRGEAVARRVDGGIACAKTGGRTGGF